MKFNLCQLKSIIIGSFTLLIIFGCSEKNPINVLKDKHFTADGRCKDTLYNFVSEQSTSIKFYVEVSGSMNGYFRRNIPTRFKNSVWSIFSNFKDWTDRVYTFGASGKKANQMHLDDFKTKMNTGAFVSVASTMVPDMIKTVLNDLNWKQGEVAVLVSDMKYSPVGQKAMDVLLSQYATDIRNVFADNDVAISLIAATSDYYDRNGKSLCEKSPYYYLVLGKPENVVWMKNCISTLLIEDYVDSFEFGINYETPAYALSKWKNMRRLKEEPTFTNFDKERKNECSFVLTLGLKDYPWKLLNAEVLKEYLKIETRYGSKIDIDTIICKEDNHYEKKLQREAQADVYLTLRQMIKEADVVECTVSIPEKLYTNGFGNFLGAVNGNQYDKSFSIESFLEGCFRGKSNHWNQEPIRILISTIEK